MRGICAAILAGFLAGGAIAQDPELPAGLTIPPQAADGSFQTINSDIGPETTIWHVRSALNVAALTCHDDSQKALVSDYNALIAKQRKSFAASNAAMEQAYKVSYPSDWRHQHDLYMTRLYNFFSQPLAQDAFCRVAVGVAIDAGKVPAGQFGSFAPGALARLEAPFLALYRRYDDYRRAYAAWQRNAASGVTSATSAPPTLLAYDIDLADAAPPVAGHAPVAIIPPVAPALAYAPLPDGTVAGPGTPRPHP